jgi:hypothetical protein
MNQREINSTDDLHKTLRENWYRHLIFRGEDRPDYTLQPKFGRFPDSRNDVEIERSTLEEFKRLATPHIQHLPANDWEWLALAQHHGLATRLLDWTQNPLIAAFFATSQATSRSDRVLYALDTQQFMYADQSVTPFDIADIVLYKPKHIAHRISTQSALFTCHNSPRDALSDDRLERWLIKDECVLEIRATLLSFGINEAFVFADLNGLSQYLNLSHVWGIHL